MRKFVIQKPDLDTCLTALLLGVREADSVITTRVGAGAQDLNNPEVICIEAGGSGQIRLNNFDHHDLAHEWPTACVQAWRRTGDKRQKLGRLVDYVDKVDRGIPIAPAIPFPSLSGLFAGMLHVERAPLAQFHSGLALLQRVLEKGYDPFAPIPLDRPWRRYAAAQLGNRWKLSQDLEHVTLLHTHSGRQLGFLESQAYGGTRALYAKGCDIVVKYHPRFGLQPVRKFTISSDGLSLSFLAEKLNRLELGWGGRCNVIGSPRTGSWLDPDRVIELVRRWC
jgi:hypothetical protein